MREWGDAAATPLLAFHGLGRTGSDFGPLATALRASHRVIAPDCPGRGLSQWLDTAREYDMDRMEAFAKGKLLSTLAGLWGSVYCACMYEYVYVCEGCVRVYVFVRVACLNVRLTVRPSVCLFVCVCVCDSVSLPSLPSPGGGGAASWRALRLAGHISGWHARY